ncbi:hypothetical protein ACFLSQ_08005 [Bacteroidota bacterium]
MPALNNTQIEILKLFDRDIPESELKEIKKMLAEYLAKKAISAADEVWEKRNYSDSTIENWKNDHMRVSQK